MNNRSRLARSIALLLVVFLALALAVGQVAGQEPGPGTPDDDFSVYLPLVVKSPSLIYGRVTDNGAPAAGASLLLWYDDGYTISVWGSTITDANGNYSFRDLPAERLYWIEYFNDEHDPSHLGNWQTRWVNIPTGGGIVNMGSFDIANVELTYPVGKLLVDLPHTFRWAPRPATPTDSYEFRLSGYKDYSQEFSTAPLGYTDNYTLSALPPGFKWCLPYIWNLYIQSPDGGWGSSYWSAWVTLYNAAPAGIHGCVSVAGAPGSNVQLTLWKRSGTTWDSQGTFTTDRYGYFQFTGQGSLNPEQSYLVEYENVADGQSRLAGYDTRELTSYTSGSSVHIGDFDIANIVLNSPAPEANVTLPYDFEWTWRGIMWDDYVFNLLSPGHAAEFSSPLLDGYNHYNLQALPPDFSYGVQNTWRVWVFDQWDGAGLSYEQRLVSFSSMGTNIIPIEKPVQIELEQPLRHLPGAQAMQPANTSRPETQPFVHLNLEHHWNR